MRILENSEKNKLDLILLQEGERMTRGECFRGTITASNQPNVVNLSPNFSKAQIYLNAETDINSNNDCVLYFSFNGDSTGANGLDTLVNLPVSKGANIKMKHHLPLTQLGIQFGILADSTKAGEQITVGGLTTGVRMINDLNFNANKKIFWLGDSIAAFTSNDIGVNNFYQFQVRNKLNELNKNSDIYRLTQKASGGRTSVHFNSMLDSGFLYQDEPTFIFYQLGVNDSTQATTPALYKANIENLIRYKKIYWKNSILVLLGSTPLQNNTAEALLETYREKMREAQNESNDSKVIFIDLKNSFDRLATPTTIWASSDTPLTNTSCVHPGTKLAHDGIANTIISGLQSYNLIS